MEIIICLRFYKYLDVIDKGKKAEDKCFLVIYRYEIELMLNKWDSFFKAVSKIEKKI